MHNLEGPRGTRIDERDKMIRLVNHVFMEQQNRSGDMREFFPVLFADQNLENCRILLDGGQPVTHVGYVVRDAIIRASTVTLACVGSVCTYEDYRGRGLASAVLDDCEARMRRQGVDVVLVSGGRGLYLRRGARTVGRHVRYRLTPADANRLEDRSISIRPARAEDRPILAALYDMSPVRHVRSPLDWDRWLACGWCGMAVAPVYFACRGDEPTAYVVQAKLRDEQEAAVAHEWAGDAAAVAALLAALPGLSERAVAEVVADPIMDGPLVAILDAAGLDAEPANFGRTVKVLRPSALFDKLRPQLTPRGRDIRVTATGDGARLKLGPDALELAADEVARAFFGDPDDVLPARFESAGSLGRAWLDSFPFPLPRYGYNYA